MRVSHSSSLFLAALAVSSSTSSFAAPTEPGTLGTSAVSSSSSIRSLAMLGRDDSMMVSVQGPNQHQGGAVVVSDHVAEMHSHHRRQLESLIPTLAGLPLVGPILGPLLDKLLSILGLAKGGAMAIEGALPSSLTPEQLEQAKVAMEEAIQKMTSSIGGIANSGVNGTTTAIGVKREAANDPLSASTFSSAATVSASSSTSSWPATGWEAMEDVPTPSVGAVAPKVTTPLGGTNGTAPASPALPVNPPNSPTLPTNVKTLVPNTSGTTVLIRREGPPMFSGFKAADVFSSYTSGSYSSTPTDTASSANTSLALSTTSNSALTPGSATPSVVSSTQA
ncbi:hypothetical protein C8Q79DRAFT_104891 [Trametes meyenii]|nr:hypothetical protein C8Q79DRAFT_104891 [Trametes meyenii]